MAAVLFLDFDGVLHPDQVYITASGPQLRSAGELFMWIPVLEAALAPYPDIKIVLSTSWVRKLGFSRAKKRLSPTLQKRVVGSTWHSSMAKVWADQIWWDGTSRHGQISRYAARSGITRWLALDDDAENWAAADLHRLILLDGAEGLSSPAAAVELDRRLAALTLAGRPADIDERLSNI
jgi:hypothetical protein